jgi:hypothetical protein
MVHSQHIDPAAVAENEIARRLAWLVQQAAKHTDVAHDRPLKEVLAAVLERALRYRLDPLLYRVVWHLRVAADQIIVSEGFADPNSAGTARVLIAKQAASKAV